MMPTLSTSTGYCGILRKRVLGLSPAVDMLEHIMNRRNNKDSQKQFRSRNSQRKIAKVAFDEVICISQKGDKVTFSEPVSKLLT